MSKARPLTHLMSFWACLRGKCGAYASLIRFGPFILNCSVYIERVRLKLGQIGERCGVTDHGVGDGGELQDLQQGVPVYLGGLAQGHSLRESGHHRAHHHAIKKRG